MGRCLECNFDYSGNHCPRCKPHLRLDFKERGFCVTSAELDYNVFYRNNIQDDSEETVLDLPKLRLSGEQLQKLEALFRVAMADFNGYDNEKSVFANTVVAMIAGEFNLPLLYRLFLLNEDAKGIALELYRNGFFDLKQCYKAVKCEIVQTVLNSGEIVDSDEDMNVKEDEDMNVMEDVEVKPQKSWRKKSLRLFEGGVIRDGYLPDPQINQPLCNQRLCWLDFPMGSSWFRCMVVLSTIRKTLSTLNASLQVPINHLTVLNFGHFSLFVLNTKDDHSGTTRMLWPMTKSEEIAGQDKYTRARTSLRVLDMTYRDVYGLLPILRLHLNCDDRQLARYMLGVLRGDIPMIVKLHNCSHSIYYQHCSFLYGVGMSDGCLNITGDIRLSKRSRSPKTLDLLKIEVTSYETICYMLSILFLAEPRHALGMWRSTILSLELVESGHLKLWQLFSTLEGNIKYGRLLPGANVLGKSLDPTATLKEKTIETHNSSMEMGESNNVSQVICTCEKAPKRLAMPLVDSVLYILPAEVEWNYEDAVTGASDNPIYQPLMKVLFLELLETVVRCNTEMYVSVYDSPMALLEAGLLLIPKEPIREIIIPVRTRKPGSDDLITFDGLIPYAVTNDNNALFRVIALHRDLDEEMHGGYRTKAATKFVVIFKNQNMVDGLQAMTLFAVAASANLGGGGIVELQKELKECPGIPQALANMFIIISIKGCLPVFSDEPEDRWNEFNFTCKWLCLLYKCRLKIYRVDTGASIKHGNQGNRLTIIAYNPHNNQCHLLLTPQEHNPPPPDEDINIMIDENVVMNMPLHDVDVEHVAGEGNQDDLVEILEDN